MVRNQHVKFIAGDIFPHQVTKSGTAWAFFVNQVSIGEIETSEKNMFYSKHLDLIINVESPIPACCAPIACIEYVQIMAHAVSIPRYRYQGIGRELIHSL